MKRIGPQDRSQIASFHSSNDFASRLASAFALVTDWSAAMAGNLRLADVVDLLGMQVGAAHISLVRFTPSEDRIQPIVAVDRRGANSRPERMSGALARFVTLHCKDDMIPGKIFRVSELSDHPAFPDSAAEREWSGRPEIRHVSLVLLGEEGESLDFMEMLYERVPDFDVDLPMALIAIALAEAWAMRTPGLVLGLIAKYGIRNRMSPAAFHSHILSPDNPYALSRSQQRVCQLLAAGQKASDIADLLGVSITTVRSHLSNIYAKTGTSGQFEVMALINSVDPGALRQAAE